MPSCLPRMGRIEGLMFLTLGGKKDIILIGKRRDMMSDNKQI